MPQPGRLSGLLTRACDQTDARAQEAAYDELLRLLMIFVRAGMGGRLREHRESVDVCQSLARSFIEDYGRGTLSFDSEAALAGYLQRTVRSKLADLARHDGAAKRGGTSRPAPIGIGGENMGIDPPSGSPGPPSTAVEKEDRDRAMAALAPEEQTVVRLRADGMSWEEIARQTGREPAALRQQFSRLQRRVIDDLSE